MKATTTISERTRARLETAIRTYGEQPVSDLLDVLPATLSRAVAGEPLAWSTAALIERGTARVLDGEPPPSSLEASE
jgi:hypothetical protein